jgi:two-component system, LytTR family, response regulator
MQDRRTWLTIAPPSGLALWVGGTLLLWAMYCFVFVVTTDATIGPSMMDAAANVLPLSLLAAASSALLRQHVMPRPVLLQAGVHTALAFAFATTWYALVLVMLAFFDGLRGRGFSVSGFSGPAFTWQVFQGLIIYALVAATCYAIRGGRQTANVAIVTGPPLERYLTRAGDEMVPVAVREIVTITGAQDYAEVVTLTGKHLVRMSLGEFERRLDPVRFVRVHRSTILNFDHLDRAEPAGGGRMLAHMANGEVVQVSRAGAQTLRSFMV